MTIPISSATAARQWLFDQLTASLTPDALSASSQLLVCLDEPGTYQPDDIVVVGAIQRDIETNSMVGSGGAGWLQEKYRISVAVEVYRGGDDAQAVFARSCALVDAIAAVVRTDVTMGGSVLISRPVSSSYEGSWDDDHLGRIGSSTVLIECYQRI